MPLIDDVKSVCDRLAPLGWRDVLLAATGQQLDIKKATAAALRTELTKDLTAIDRTAPGFSDFALAGTKAIAAGFPANSLLYHALASPGVTKGINGFPTLKEIETIENFVFGVTPPTLASLKTRAGLTAAQKFSVVLFFYEYRPARDTVRSARPIWRSRERAFHGWALATRGIFPRIAVSCREWMTIPLPSACVRPDSPRFWR